MLSDKMPKINKFIFIVFLLAVVGLAAFAAGDPPDIPTLIAPPHNIWIDDYPIFRAMVSDPDGEQVRAHFNIVGYGSGVGTWVESGGISEWGPINLGDCAEYSWRAYAEDISGLEGGWYGYWRVKVDTGAPSSTISYTIGTISDITFSVYLEESGGCFGTVEGNVDVSIDGGVWQDHLSTIDDFDYTGSYGQCYKFRYQVENEKGNLSDWAEGGEVCIQLPLPTVDIKVNGSNGPITINYDNSATLTWTSTDVTSCTASDDWSGNKAASGSESTGNLVSSKTYALTCIGPGGSASDSVTINVSSATLSTTLFANPDSGTAPLNNVVLNADPSGSAIGTINYTFYCDRSDSGTNITAGYVYKLDGINNDPYSAPVGVCDSAYANPGTYTAKVIIERDGLTAEARAVVTVGAAAPTITSVNPNSGPIAGGTAVTITGVNFVSALSTNVTFGGTAAQVNTTSFTEIEVTTPEHTAGAVNVVVTNPDGQSGTLANGYTYIGPPAPTVSLTADPSTIDEGQSSTLTWTSTNADDGCSAFWTTSTATSGSGDVSPTETTTYYAITCTGPGGSDTDSVEVMVIGPPPPGIVPCGRPGTPDCQLCHFFVLAKNIITGSLQAVAILASLFVVIGGILILTSGGSPEPMTKGKKAILFAVIGVVVALVAWVIINTVIGLLVNPDVFPWPWNKIPLDIICPS